MKTLLKSVLLGSLTLAASAFSQPKKKEITLKEEKPGLLAQAKIKPDDARKTALAKVAGHLRSMEIEEEKGKLVYAFDIKVAHQSGLEEVVVDATTGEVISVQHEDAKAAPAPTK